MAYVENPIVEGKDFKSVITDINGNFKSLGGIVDFTLQKPWDINENVGSIVVNSLGGILPHFDKNGLVSNQKNRLSIYMINSGVIIVSFKVYRYESWVHVKAVDVSVNDKIFRRITANEVANDEHYYTFSVPVEVCKGDYVDLTIYGYAQYSHDETAAGGILLSDVSLSANIDTPYKYISVPTKGTSVTGEMPEI